MDVAATTASYGDAYVALVVWVVLAAEEGKSEWKVVAKAAEVGVLFAKDGCSTPGSRESAADASAPNGPGATVACHLVYFALAYPLAREGSSGGGGNASLPCE